jgi:hypothetical protein
MALQQRRAQRVSWQANGGFEEILRRRSPPIPAVSDDIALGLRDVPLRQVPAREGGDAVFTPPADIGWRVVDPLSRLVDETTGREFARTLPAASLLTVDELSTVKEFARRALRCQRPFESQSVSTGGRFHGTRLPVKSGHAVCYGWHQSKELGAGKRKAKPLLEWYRHVDGADAADLRWLREHEAEVVDVLWWVASKLDPMNQLVWTLRHEQAGVPIIGDVPVGQLFVSRAYTRALHPDLCYAKPFALWFDDPPGRTVAGGGRLGFRDFEVELPEPCTEHPVMAATWDAEYWHGTGGYAGDASSRVSIGLIPNDGLWYAAAKVARGEAI